MSGRSKIYLLIAFGVAAVVMAAAPRNPDEPDFNGWLCRMSKGFGYCVQPQ